MTPTTGRTVALLALAGAFACAIAACAGTHEEPPAPPGPPIDPAAFSGPARPPAPTVDVSADLDAAVVWADAADGAPPSPEDAGSDARAAHASRPSMR